MSSSMVRLEAVPLPIIISMVCRHTTTCETGYAGETVYDDDPVDEGIRWLRGSRCWGGGQVWEGATKPWDRYIGIPTAGDMGIL